MGRASRITEAKIKAEQAQYPWLWAKPYIVNLKRKQSETMRSIGFEWECIGFADSDMDSICASAEAWQSGAGQIVREQLKKKHNV